jgi:acetyl esterase/lipase
LTPRPGIERAALAPPGSRRRGPIARAAALVLAVAVCLALLAAGPALAAPAEGGAGGGVDGSTGRPQLLLIHGGSFLYDDPYFEPLTRPRAIAAGFVPHYVTYPLDDLPAAVDKVREEARRLREKFGLDRVYAYGSSAGGTLAALLSGDELVSAAVAKAPVSDLITWDWATEKYGAEYWEGLGMDQAARERLSPIRRLQLAPLLIIQGRGDHIVPPAMNETFAAAYPRVDLWLVAGGHTTERTRPFLVTRAMDWLARIAAEKMAPPPSVEKNETEKTG